MRLWLEDSDEDRLRGFIQAGAAFCTSTCSAIGIAGLFVIFATPHFLFDSSMLDELPKSFDSVLNFLPVSKSQLDHQTLPFC